VDRRVLISGIFCAPLTTLTSSWPHSLVKLGSNTYGQRRLPSADKADCPIWRKELPFPVTDRGAAIWMVSAPIRAVGRRSGLGRAPIDEPGLRVALAGLKRGLIGAWILSGRKSRPSPQARLIDRCPSQAGSPGNVTSIVTS
jgi:hypothetical protein